MRVIYSEKSEGYEFPGHPESPERIRNTYRLLKNKKNKFIEASPATEQDILLVHSRNLLEKVKKGLFIDQDTPSSKEMFEYALLSCGAAIQAQQLALNSKPAFSLMRPPGHHATKESPGGFCYFNNIAVSVIKALDSVKKVVIIDIDCHHGNGSQDIFLGNERVLYISLHQSPLYPGTGLKSVKNCLNFPLPPETTPEKYLEIFKNALIEAENFSPQLIAVSAGFDTYKNDPLSSLNLEKQTYAAISGLIHSLRIPTFSVLEGGYSSDLPECIEQYLIGFK